MTSAAAETVRTREATAVPQLPPLTFFEQSITEGHPDGATLLGQRPGTFVRVEAIAAPRPEELVAAWVAVRPRMRAELEKARADALAGPEAARARDLVRRLAEAKAQHTQSRGRVEAAETALRQALTMDEDAAAAEKELAEAKAAEGRLAVRVAELPKLLVGARGAALDVVRHAVAWRRAELLTEAQREAAAAAAALAKALATLVPRLELARAACHHLSGPAPLKNGADLAEGLAEAPTDFELARGPAAYPHATALQIAGGGAGHHAAPVEVLALRPKPPTRPGVEECFPPAGGWPVDGQADR